MVRPSQKRMIFICQVFYPDAQSTSQLFTQLLRDASLTDWRIEVLCGFPSYLSACLGISPRQELLDSIRIRRCGLPIDMKRSYAGRAASYVSFLLHVLWRLLGTSKDRHVLVGTTNPPFLGILLSFVWLFKRIPYIVVLHDLHPEGLVAGGGIAARSPIVRMWTRLNKFAYARAKALLVLGRDMAGLLLARYRVAPDRIKYVPNWSPAESVRPVAFTESTLVQQLGLNRSFVVQYSGNMGLWHDIDILVRAAEQLQHDARLRFLFIGSGIRRSQAETLSRQRGLNNVIWRQFVPQDQLHDSLACCHVSIVSMRAGLTGVAVPSKIYGILASGRAVIAQVPGDSEIAMVVREEQCGVVVEPGDLDGLVAAIHALSRDPHRVAVLGQKAFNAYRAKYTLARAVRDFREAVDQALPV